MALSYETLNAYIEGLYGDGILTTQEYNDIILYILANGEISTSARDLIQVRRGNLADLPALAQGELGFTLDEEIMYVGGVNGNVDIGNKELINQHSAQLADIAYSVRDKTTEEIQEDIDNYHLKGTIFFPNTDTNIYILTDTLLLPSNTNIMIADRVTLKLSNGVNKPLIKNVDATNGNTKIKIVGGIFDMNIANQTLQTPVISFSKVTNSHFKNMEIGASKFNEYRGEGSFDFSYCDNNIIEDCILHNSAAEGLAIIGNNNKVIGGKYYNNPNGSGIALTSGEHNDFIGVWCDSNTGSNFSINGRYSTLSRCLSTNGVDNNAITLGHPGRPADYSIVDSCIVKNNADGIRVLASSIGVIISNNQVTGNNQSESIAIGISDMSLKCVVKGNMLSENLNGIYAGDYTIVTGNYVELCTVAGISVFGSHCVISDNICINNGQGPSTVGFGLNVSALSMDNIIKGNQCSDTQEIPTQKRGIYGMGVRNHFVNNVCLGNVSDEMTLLDGNFATKNILSKIDGFRFTYTFPDSAGSETILNANITTQSKISWLPNYVSAIDRKPTLVSINKGSLAISFIDGVGGSIEVFID